jgi:hypothetical protein
VVCRNANAERERNFAKCWGFGGKYFAKFASRALGFFGGILAGRALRKKIHNIEISAKPRYKLKQLNFL